MEREEFKSYRLEDAPELLTLKEVSKFIPSLRRYTLMKLIQSGELPVKRWGRKYYIPKRALKEWIDSLV